MTLRALRACATGGRQNGRRRLGAGARGSSGVARRDGFWQRDGIGGPQDSCTFGVITAESEARFHVIGTCAGVRDPARAETFERVFEVTGHSTSRAERADGWVVEVPNCPQASVADPGDRPTSWT